jgi:Domain of unknown function (DUF4388)/Inner membrane component of T3SS, cytoplasmic domain
MTTAVLQGSLGAFTLPEVLTFLSTTRKSGTLTVAHDSREASLFFAEGELVYAGSNQEQFRLGSILLRKKMITPDQRDRVDALMRNDGGQFGTRAVQHGVLSDDQLRDFLKVQVSEIVYDSFVWPAGSFTFADGVQLPSHAVTIAVDLPNLIMEGARRIAEWEQCLRLLPDSQVVFRVVTSPRDEKITLTADEWRILFLINGQRTLEELCKDAEDDAFQVYRVVYGLHANTLIEVVPRNLVVEEEVTPAGPPTGQMPAVIGDDTFKQSSPVFHAESTVRELSDDTSLLVSSEAHLSYADVVKPTVAQLTTQNGDNTGTTFPLVEAEYLVGRHRDNGIQLSDLGVSGFHARIYRGPDGYTIEDLKSRNGTFVNGARVFHAALQHGDRVHIGATDLLFEVLYESA